MVVQPSVNGKFSLPRDFPSSKTVYPAPPVSQLAAVLNLYLKSKQKQSENTVAYILAPAALGDNDWSPLLKGMRCVSLFLKHSKLHPAAAPLCETYAMYCDAAATSKFDASVQSMNVAPGLKMQFSGSVSGAQARVLLDTGAAETYMSYSFAKAHGLTIVQAPGYTVAMSANGSPVTIHGVAVVSLKVQAFNCQMRCWVAELGDAWDLIVGESWLCQHRAELSYEKLEVLLHAEKGSVRLQCAPSVALPAPHSDTRGAVAPMSGTVPLLSAVQMADVLADASSRSFVLSVSAVEDAAGTETEDGEFPSSPELEALARIPRHFSR